MNEIQKAEMFPVVTGEKIKLVDAWYKHNTYTGTGIHDTRFADKLVRDALIFGYEYAVPETTVTSELLDRIVELEAELEALHNREPCAWMCAADGQDILPFCDKVEAEEYLDILVSCNTIDGDIDKCVYPLFRSAPPVPDGYVMCEKEPVAWIGKASFTYIKQQPLAVLFDKPILADDVPLYAAA